MTIRLAPAAEHAGIRTHFSFRAAALALVLCAMAIVATGCKTVPTALPPTQTWEERRMELQQRAVFELRGRLAVAAGEEGFNARLRWKQEGPQSHLALDGPLGVGGVQIAANGEALTVRNSRGEQLDEAAARQEMAARLGFEPPIESLRYWVLGVPDPAHPADVVLDEEQRLARLTQQGWEIEYGKYAPTPEGWLPVRMTLKRSDVRVRLVVDAWHS